MHHETFNLMIILPSLFRGSRVFCGVNRAASRVLNIPDDAKNDILCGQTQELRKAAARDVCRHHLVWSVVLHSTKEM